MSKDTISVRIDQQAEPLQVAKGATVLSILAENKEMGNHAIAAKCDGKEIDLHAPLEGDCQVDLISYSDEEGKEIHYHSTSHLMAQAVLELYPEAKLAIGPPIENGFYYDFDVPQPFTPDDLKAIEKRMKELSKKKIPVERFVMSREEAIDYYKGLNQDYKVEIIEELDEPEVSFYRQGDFTDMCRGPHVPHTGYLKNFKLLSIAGAYWRGDERRLMLQRIYGTAAASKDELKDYLHKLEEAKERDHRKLGKELDLFSLHEEAGPGLVFWHPHGARIRTIIEDFWRKEHYKHGYEQIMIPHILKEDLFRQSGHLDNYNENMFPPMEMDGSNYYAKPMNCPGHILIYKTQLRSYRDLPIRYAELGTVYRYERSGVLHGLLRVRGFTQDDAHVFCRPDQLADEIKAVVEMADFMMQAFGFEYKLCLSTRPEKSIGSDEIWETAENTLREVLENRGKPYDVEEAGGAFYGPKIDVNLLDALGRMWQGPTIQLDFNLPERFDVDYIGSDGERKKVVMIHRTVLGSMERFLGNLLEHYKGAFPGWLSPVQAIVLPITDELIPYADALHGKLKQMQIRSEVDDRNEKIGYKIREAEKRKIPVMLVVGKQERDEGSVSVRERGKKDLGSMSLDQAFQYIQEKMAVPGSTL
ncbi:threonine--tRNA ligase, partial [bacterium]|nr:threonine--tRNA ligase [bacterium]